MCAVSSTISSVPRVPRIDEGDLVRHRRGREVDRLLVPEERGGAPLELENGGILPALLVPHLGRRHRSAHARRGRGLRVGTKIDHPVSLRDGATLEEVLKPLVAAFFTLALVASASAAPVDTATQQQIKMVLEAMDNGDLAYVPTYVPRTYSAETTHESPDEFGVTFTSSKHGPKSPGYTAYAIFYKAKAVKGSAGTCSKSARATVKVNGKTVYWNGRDAAWQCVKAPGGRLIGVSAVSAKAGQTELVRVAASIAPMR